MQACGCKDVTIHEIKGPVVLEQLLSVLPNEGREGKELATSVSTHTHIHTHIFENILGITKDHWGDYNVSAHKQQGRLRVKLSGT